MANEFNFGKNINYPVVLNTERVKTMSYKATTGLLVWIEGDKKGEWYTAKDWQYNRFIISMQFGTMKTMGYPNLLEKTEPFTQDKYKYRFHIHNDWNPCYIENMTTKKIREIKYFELGINAHDYNNQTSTKKSKITPL